MLEIEQFGLQVVKEIELPLLIRPRWWALISDTYEDDN